MQISPCLGFTGGSAIKNLPAMQETWIQLLDWKDHLEEEIATYSSILAGKSHGQRSLVGYSPQGHKELDMAYWLNNNIVSMYTDSW